MILAISFASASETRCILSRRPVSSSGGASSAGSHCHQEPGRYLPQMPRKWFHPPVVVETDRIGQTYRVNSVESASQQLLSWEKHGPRWRVAAETCLLALEGSRTAEEARAEFVEAAREAGKLRSDE